MYKWRFIAAGSSLLCLLLSFMQYLPRHSFWFMLRSGELHIAVLPFYVICIASIVLTIRRSDVLSPGILSIAYLIDLILLIVITYTRCTGINVMTVITWIALFAAAILHAKLFYERRKCEYEEDDVNIAIADMFAGLPNDDNDQG